MPSRRPATTSPPGRPAGHARCSRRSAPSCRPGMERARALLILARLRSYDDDIRAAVELFETAITEADGDRAILSLAHEGVSGNLFRLRERFAEAVEHAREAVSLRRERSVTTTCTRQLSARSSSPKPRSGSTDARETFPLAETAAASGGGVRVLQGIGIPGRRRPHVVGGAGRGQGLVRADAGPGRARWVTRAPSRTSTSCSRRRSACAAPMTPRQAMPKRPAVEPSRAARRR